MGGLRAWLERPPLQRTVRILLECILVLITFAGENEKDDQILSTSEKIIEYKDERKFDEHTTLFEEKCGTQNFHNERFFKFCNSV